jgi:hypothetical protein
MKSISQLLKRNVIMTLIDYCRHRHYEVDQSIIDNYILIFRQSTKNFHCRICGLKFPFVAELKNHQLSHESKAENGIDPGTENETKIRFRGSSRSADQQSGGINKGIIKVSFSKDLIIICF